MGETAKAGSALQAAFKARGCALGDDEARALAIALRDLIASGLIGPDPLLAVQQATGHAPSGRDLRSDAKRVPAHNMGSSLYI